ncbi:MAG: HU family DNA-binding protein [Hyphomicrobiaceae bacterium]|nr:HU family DNA-binding protein [Hyphomicrobiaceae bacterium]
MAAKAKAKPAAKAKAKPKAPAKAVKKTASKTAKTAKAAKAQTTVTLRHLGDAIAATHEMPKKQANAMLSEMVDMIATHLKKGARIRIGGLGILQVRNRPARMGRNPATGEQIKIKASKKIAFRAAKELKESV